MSFENFMELLQSCPHIAERILTLLDVVDIVSCMSTCKGLKNVIVNTLMQNKRIKIHFDTEASKNVCKRGNWKRRRIGPLQSGEFMFNECVINDWVVSIDSDSLAFHDPTDNSCSVKDMQHLGGLKYEMRRQILPANGVMFEAEDAIIKVQLPNREGDSEIEISGTHKHGLHAVTSDWGRTFLRSNSSDLRTVRNVDEFTFEMGLFDSHGQLMRHFLKIRQDDEPEGFIRKDNLVMVAYSEALAVTDLTNGKQVWRVSTQRLGALPIPRTLFMSAKFCGFVYDEGFFDPNKPEDLWEREDEDPMRGEFRAALYETKTGKKIDDILCWKANICFYEGVEIAPFVKVSGEYVSMIGYANLDYDTDYQDIIFCMKIAQGAEESGSFSVEKTRVFDVERMMLRKLNLSTERVGRGTQVDPEIPSIQTHKLEFWGEHHPDGVMFFQLMFSSERNRVPGEDHSKSHNALLVLDLNRALDPSCEEPYHDALTIPFPIADLRNPDAIDYIAMFKSWGDGGVMLTGAAEADFRNSDTLFCYHTAMTFDQTLKLPRDQE